MSALKESILFGIFLVLIVLPQASFAADLAVSYAILTSETEGEMVRGTMRVEVLNLTSGDLHNVDLRLEQGSRNSIERGVFQAGRIPGGEVRVVTGGFLFEQEFLNSGLPIVWQVDYDDALRNHKQAVVAGIKLDE